MVLVSAFRRSGFFVLNSGCTRVWSPSRVLWIRLRLQKQPRDSLGKLESTQNFKSVSDGLFESRINRWWALKWLRQASIPRIQYAYRKVALAAVDTWAAGCLSVEESSQVQESALWAKGRSANFPGQPPSIQEHCGDVYRAARFLWDAVSADRSVQDLMLQLTGIDISRCPVCQQGTLVFVANLPVPGPWDSS